MPIGEARWLTVVSPERPDEPELLLEPMGFAPARITRKRFRRRNSFDHVCGEDIHKDTREWQTRSGLQNETNQDGPVTIAVFEDTCGNLIQLVHK